jgi:hypothetical protein
LEGRGSAQYHGLYAIDEDAPVQHKAQRKACTELLGLNT